MGVKKIIIFLGKCFGNDLIKMSHKEAKKTQKCTTEFGVAETTVKTKWGKRLE